MKMVLKYFLRALFLAGSLVKLCFSDQDSVNKDSNLDQNNIPKAPQNNMSENSNYLSKIAIVDVQYILANSLAIKDLRRQIESITQDLHTQMTDKELDLKKSQENLIGLKGQVPPLESEKQTSIFNKKVSEAQEYAQQQKIKLEKTNSDGILQVHNATIEIIKEVCKARSCSIVIPSSQLLYADPELNITLEVLERLNKKISTMKVNF
jgi:outer membrane protein